MPVSKDNTTLRKGKGQARPRFSWPKLRQAIEFYESEGLCCLPAYWGYKDPYVKWEEFQTRLPTRAEKTEWFREGKPRNPPQITGFWGRGASPYKPGIFTKRYFVEHGEACAADVFYALSEEIERLNKERIEIGEKPFERPNYSSFSRYFHWFLILGLIERTDKKEPAIYVFLQLRVFYRLTDKGKAEVKGWEDPIGVRHPEFR